MMKKIVFACIAVFFTGLANANPQFQESDSNNDGYINAEEAAAASGVLSSQMEVLDIDKDGKLDPAEFAGFEIVVPEAVPEVPK